VEKVVTQREKKCKESVSHSSKDICSQEHISETTPDTMLPFPLNPATNEFEFDIIRKACRRMDPSNFEEVGCAMCGELKPGKDSS
jgi:hypothetical protein